MDNLFLELVKFNGYWSKRAPPSRIVTCRISEGDWVAILGDNGTGKSTLAKALAGFTPFCVGALVHGSFRLRPGKAEDRFRASLVYISQEPCFPRDFSISLLAAVYFGNRNRVYFDRAVDALISEILRQIGIARSDVTSLPSQVKEFILGLAISPTILVLDEISTVLRVGGLNVCPYQLVKQFCPNTIVFFIDHAREKAVSTAKFVIYLGDPLGPRVADKQIPVFCAVDSLSKEARQMMLGDQSSLEGYVRGEGLMEVRDDEPVYSLLKSAFVASRASLDASTSELMRNCLGNFPFLRNKSATFGQLSGGQKLVVLALVQKALLDSNPPPDVLGHLSNATTAMLRDALGWLERRH